MNSVRRIALTLIVALSFAHLHAEDDQREMNVNVAMSDAGKKVAPPTKEHPAYYYPFVVGYKEEGSKVAGEVSPPIKPIVHQLAKALAVTPPNVPPSLIWSWPSWLPEKKYVSLPPPPVKVSFPLPT